MFFLMVQDLIAGQLIGVLLSKEESDRDSEEMTIRVSQRKTEEGNGDSTTGSVLSVPIHNDSQ